MNSEKSVIWFVSAILSAERLLAQFALQMSQQLDVLFIFVDLELFFQNL